MGNPLRTTAVGLLVPLVVVQLLPLAAGAPAVQPAPGHPDATIVAVVPNPTAHDDAGERLVIEFREPTNVSGWTITDGETVARLPDRTVSGRVVATTDPDAIPPPPSNATVVHLAGRLALANAGETIVLRGTAGVVATVSYADAPEGERYVRDGGEWVWKVPGTTDRPVVTDRNVPAELFVLPDDPSVPRAAIESADRRVLLAAYTFASERIADALCSAASRDVHVEVLLEGEPVGGVTRSQAAALDRLVGCGVRVAVLGGPGDRYGVHHAKYAVVDDRALVLSENWKPSGTGGRSNRGWGVLLRSPRIAAGLAETFRADADFRDARPWTAVRNDVELTTAPAANGSFPRRFAPRTVEVDRVDLLVAPDNAEAGLVGLIDDADASIRVQQVTIGGLEDPLANATMRATNRGVSARFLLSGAWYAVDDNRKQVERIERLARTDGLPLSARLLRPRSRFEKSHVKGVLVDGEAAVVGSLNWNAYAARENREVVVVLTDPEAAGYYGRVFRADWRGGTWRLPVVFGLVVALAGVSTTAVLVRSIEFAEEPPPSDPAAW